MKAFFEGIEDLFVDVLFWPFDFFPFYGELVGRQYRQLDFGDNRNGRFCLLDVGVKKIQ